MKWECEKCIHRSVCGEWDKQENMAACSYGDYFREDILGDDFDPERLKVLVNQRMTMREEVAERFGITKNIPIDRLRDLVEADREGRVVALPKDGMIYYIEEAGGEKWVANKPIQQITVKCGWGLATLEFSLLDTGKYFSREAAEAALKGEQDGKKPSDL